MALLCDECDEQSALKYCTLCDQKLCIECDIRIHNKGKRALHIRAEITNKKKEYLMGSESRVKLAKTELFSFESLHITVFQSLNLPEKFQSKELIRLQSIAGDYFIEEAYRGNLMHDLEEFKSILHDRLQNETGSVPFLAFEEAFHSLQQTNFFHITVRTFGDAKPLKYVSLHLQNISLEAIIWILYSIKNDRMKPTDKLVLSRIKEYFLLKISQKDWNASMDYFYSHPKCLACTDLLPTLSLVDERETSSKMNTRSETDGGGKDEKLTSAYYFEFISDNWAWEDVMETEEKDDQDWASFKRYLDNFFSEDTPFASNDSRSKLKKQKNTRNIQKWLSSVETELSKPSGTLSANHSLQKILSEQSISRAIPGGKSK